MSKLLEIFEYIKTFESSGFYEYRGVLLIMLVIISPFLISYVLSPLDSKVRKTRRQEAKERRVQRKAAAANRGAASSGSASGSAFATTSRERELDTLVSKGDTTAYNCRGLRSGIFDLDDFD